MKRTMQSFDPGLDKEGWRFAMPWKLKSRPFSFVVFRYSLDSFTYKG